MISTLLPTAGCVQVVQHWRKGTMARALAAWRQGMSCRQDLEVKKASATLKWLGGMMGRAFYSWKVGWVGWGVGWAGELAAGRWGLVQGWAGGRGRGWGIRSWWLFEGGCSRVPDKEAAQLLVRQAPSCPAPDRAPRRSLRGRGGAIASSPRPSCRAGSSRPCGGR
jgi:hypothetical protein